MGVEQVRIEDVIAVVKKAKELCRNREQALKITEKGAANFVTEVDICVQSYMKEELHNLYPMIQLMGEEQDNTTINFSKPVWILDPVDGTSNLIHDFRHSSLSLALYADHELKMGIICDLFGDEIFWAEKGKGSYLNGTPIHVSSIQQMERSLISIGTSPYRKELAEEGFELYKRIFLCCEDIRRLGSAALELAYVAAGRIETYFEYNLNPWDFAAGILIIEEAGGSVTDYQGDLVDVTKGSSIVAGNGVINHRIVNDFIKRIS